MSALPGGPWRVRRTRDGEVWTEHHEPSGAVLRLLGPCSINGILWFRLCNFSGRRLPPWLLLPVMWVSAVVCWVLLRQVRRGISRNLAVVLGKAGLVERERRIFRTLYMFARCVGERHRLFGRRDELRIEFEGGDHWQRAMAHPQSFAIMSGHFGNWEAASLIPGQHRRRIHVVREREIDAASDRFIAKCYERHAGDGFQVIYQTPDENIGPRLLLALRRGDLLGLSSDQPRTGQSFVRVTMFGRSTPMPHGPAALARASGALLVPVFAIRTGFMRYRVVVRGPIEVPRTADRDADLLAGTQAVAEQYEWAIRASPHSWFCWWERWPG